MRLFRVLLISFLAVTVLPLASTPAAEAGGGNSSAAKACQNGGYAGLVTADGRSFKNEGDCVSFAARGGQFFAGLVVPAGKTMTFHNTFVNACDPLSWGYQVSGGASVSVGSKPSCAVDPNGAIWPQDVTVGPFAATSQVRIFLADLACGDVFYSDGNHALVTPVSPTAVHVDITDSGGDTCPFSGQPRVPGPTVMTNFSVDIVFGP
jgi:hypothetical protein